MPIRAIPLTVDHALEVPMGVRARPGLRFDRDRTRPQLRRTRARGRYRRATMHPVVPEPMAADQKCL